MSLASLGGRWLCLETPRYGLMLWACNGAAVASPFSSLPLLMKSNLNLEELRNDYELNTAIVKSFHRMFMSVAKG